MLASFISRQDIRGGGQKEWPLWKFCRDESEREILHANVLLLTKSHGNLLSKFSGELVPHQSGEFFCPLDFREGLKDLRKGPWEMLLPEAQASKGTSAALRGALEARPELKPRYLTSKL